MKKKRPTGRQMDLLKALKEGPLGWVSLYNKMFPAPKNRGEASDRVHLLLGRVQPALPILPAPQGPRHKLLHKRGGTMIRKMWVLYRHDYADVTVVAVYTDEDLANIALERYDGTWGNYYVEEVQVDPPTPEYGSIWSVTVNEDDKVTARPTAYAYHPDHQDLSIGRTSSVYQMNGPMTVYKRSFLVWAPNVEALVEKVKAESARLRGLDLWRVDGRILFGEDEAE